MSVGTASLGTISMSQSRVVLITGCSSGIGRALAQAFHHRGDQVWATARNLSAMADLKAQGIHTIRLDVTDDESRNAAIAHILQQSGSIDLLINNAGYGLMGPLLDIPIDELRQQFETNVFAINALIQAVAPSMIERGSGTIANIGSVSGIFVTPFAGAYCASKAAVHALSDAWRLELAPFGLRVVTVQPGAITSQFGNTASQVVHRFLTSTSRYHSLESSIQNRANASQVDATSTEDFAAQLVNLLSRNQPPSQIRIGKKSLQLTLLRRWLPTPLLDRLLMGKFNLERINKSQ